MKSFFIFILVFSFIGCGKNLSEKSNNAKSNENNKIFTITHKATDDESVYIYLRNEDTAILIFSYEVKPNECFKLTASHFEQLAVRVGVGASWDIEFACHPDRSITCEPGNYEIRDIGTDYDDYKMLQVDSPNTTDDCIDIDHWMESKK